MPLTGPGRLDPPPDEDKERIRQNVAKMRSQGASDTEVESYLRDYEGLSPTDDSGGGGLLGGAKRLLGQAFSPQAHMDAAKTLIQGATLNAGDDMRAAIRAPLSAASTLPGIGRFVPGGDGGEAFRAALEEESADIDRIRQENPVAAAIGEMAGGAIPAALSGGATSSVTGARLLPTAGRVVGEAAALGGAYGFNEGTGGVVQRTLQGGIGAGAGIAGAGLLQGATQSLARPLLGGVSRAAVGATAGAMLPADDMGERGQNMLAGAALLTTAPYAVRLGRGMNQIGAVGRLGGMADAAGRGAARSETLAPREERSLGKILRAVRDDRPDIDFDAETARAAEQIAPVSILEQGDNTRGLARAARAVGGRAKQEIPETLEARQLGMGDRIKGYFLEHTGIGRRIDPKAALRDQAAKRVAEGNERYGEVFAAFPRGVDDPDIMRLVDDIDAAIPGGSVRKQVDDLVNLMIRRGEAKPGDFRRRIVRSTSNEPGVPDEAVDVPTLRYLDLFKQAAQRRINYAKRDPELARTFDSRREDLAKRALREYVDMLDARTGGEESTYRAARRAWGDETEVMGLIQQGEDFLKTPEREVAAIKEESSEAAWDMYRQVALDRILDYVDNVSGRHNATTRKPLDLDVPATQRKLRLLFDDDESWSAFRARMADEVEMAKSKNFVGGNSQTADKLMEIGRLFDIPIEDLVTGDPKNLLGRAAAWGANRLRTGYTTRAADELVDPLLAGARGDREEYGRLLGKMGTLARLQAERERLRGPGRRAASVAGGVGTSRIVP